MKVTYCELWSSKLRSVTDEMTAGQARERDSKGESYCVVLGEAESPSAVIEVVPENNYICVNFVDGMGRTHTAYGFRKVADGKLFLADVTLWRYPEGALRKSQASQIESYEFQPDGYAARVLKEREMPGRPWKAKKTEKRNVRVDENWEPAPEFGHWESIARYERA